MLGLPGCLVGATWLAVGEIMRGDRVSGRSHRLLPVCHTKDFDLETAIHGCLKELKEVTHITFSARNRNYNIT